MGFARTPIPKGPLPPPWSHAAHPSLGDLGDDLSHIPPQPCSLSAAPRGGRGRLHCPAGNEPERYLCGGASGGAWGGSKEGGLRAQTWGLASEPAEGRTPGGAGVTAQGGRGTPISLLSGGAPKQPRKPLGEGSPPSSFPPGPAAEGLSLTRFHANTAAASARPATQITTMKTPPSSTSGSSPSRPPSGWAARPPRPPRSS